MDSLIFQAMAADLNLRLADSRLDKVIQTGAGTLVLKFWTGQDKLQLVFKAEDQPCYYLSSEQYNAPATPPRFCQLLRARLRHLRTIHAEPLDRVAHLRFAGPDASSYDLVFEAIGGRGNLILVDRDNRIVDLLYRQDAQRKLLPGEAYSLPEQKARTWLLGDLPKVAALLEVAEQRGSLVQADLYPLTPALAHALSQARQAGQPFTALLTRIRDAFASAAFHPHKISWDGQSGYLPLSLDEHAVPVEPYPDLSMMLTAEQDEAGRDAVNDLATRLSTVIARQRKRLAKRIVHIQADKGRQAEPDKYRIMGELLLTNLHKIKHNTTQVEVEDYHQSPPVMVTIDLDPKQSPQENAQHFFKLYRKAKRSGDHHLRRLQETDEEIQWLDQVALSLEESCSAEDLYQVQLELEAAGLLKEVKGQLGKRRPPRPEDQLYQCLTPGGWQLYWGKNSRTNDHVSCHMTGSDDLWFHARGMPGTHLVLKCGDIPGSVAEEDILYAAALAAGHSKAKDAAKVEVIVAKGKAVRKPKGSRPGLVTVDKYRSVMVKPLRLDG